MAGYRGFAEWVADDFVFWRDLGLSMARVDPPVAWHVPQVLPSDIGRPHTAPVIISLTRSSHFRRRGRFGNRRLIRRRLWFAGEAFAGALALVGARPARRSSPDPSRRQPHQRRPRGRRTPVDHRPAAPVASGRPVDPATAATAAEADELLRSVSAVIPVRGPARLLTEQLAALGNHVAEIDGEIVIADNGSPSLATVLRPDLPCTIRVVPALGGRGASYARNLGAAAARGDVVVCCDADDIAAPPISFTISSAPSARRT